MVEFMTPHIHGISQPDGTFMFEPVLQCYHCEWRLQVPRLYSRNNVVMLDEAPVAGSQRRVNLRTIEGHVHTFEHYCWTAASGNNVNTETMLVRIESKLLNIEASLNYVISTKDQEITKLQQTIDLLQARLKWAEEEDVSSPDAK